MPASTNPGGDEDHVGYLSDAFAQSYRMFGEVVRLPASGLSLLKRPITDNVFDLVGIYPYTMCRDWRLVSSDRDYMKKIGAVSVVFVADPFESEMVQSALQGWTRCVPFKSHFIVDLSGDWSDGNLGRKVRKDIRNGYAQHNVSIAPQDNSLAATLWSLYQNTIDRHAVRGIQSLSLDLIEAQLLIDGAVLAVAEDNDGLAGGLLSFQHGDTANLHLEFLALRAHEMGTSYTLIHASLIELQRRGCLYANLGGVAGHSSDPDNGLFRFKKKWTDKIREAYLCGEVLDPVEYERLSRLAGSEKSDFFPRYRAPGGKFEWLAER